MSLNVAARALTTNQSVLQVIGHNIANANTVGYSRQNVSLSAVEGQQSGGGFYGKGVQIESVARSYDAFLTRQANTTQTVASADALRFEKLQQVESLFPLGAGSLGAMLNTALNAWVDVQASPADSTARQVVIDRADELAARIKDTATRLNEVAETAKLQSKEVINQINLKAEQIANLNDKIGRVIGSGAPPNDLLDQRDQLIAELSQKVQVTTIGASDGTVTVFVASSYPLVLGSKAAKLKLERDELDPDHRQTVNFVQGNSASEIPDDFLVGGELKGLQSFINQDMPNTQAELGRMALALAVGVNNQHNSGLNQSGASGGDFFTYTLSAVPDSSPPGLSISVSDHTALAASDYEVTFNTATTATVKRLSDGVSFASAGLPLTFDGLTIDQTAGATVGSKFLLRPAADAARTLDVAISRPADLAVASTVGITAGAGNSAGLSIESVNQTSTPGGALPIAIAFNASGQISLGGGPFQVFTPGKPMTVNGYSVTLRGTPAATDTFTIDTLPANAVRFNAGNAQAMLALRDAVTFDASTTLSDGYVSVFSAVASRLSESKFSAEFSQSQAASAETQRANQAGVNLDEEAAKLIQYQQAYQASAKYMGTVQSLFDTLMSAFR